jgi:hypothetical protein
MDITVHLQDGLAADLASGSPNLPQSQTIIAVAAEFGTALRPLHPGANDPELSKHFNVAADSAEAANTIAQRLLQCEGVEAAYVKPADSAPSP